MWVSSPFPGISYLRVFLFPSIVQTHPSAINRCALHIYTSTVYYNGAVRILQGGLLLQGMPEPAIQLLDTPLHLPRDLTPQY